MNEREFCMWLDGVFTMRRADRTAIGTAAMDLIEKKLREVLNPPMPDPTFVPHPAGHPDLKLFVADRAPRL